LAGEEALAARAGADRVVVDGEVGGDLGDALRPGGHGGLLRGGAAADEGAGCAAFAVALTALGGVRGAAAACGEGECSGREECCGRAETLELHVGAFRSRCGTSGGLPECRGMSPSANHTLRVPGDSKGRGM